MKIAVLCEFSGVVRDAFLARGHDAVSCDLLPTERDGPHIVGNCLDHDWSRYDIVIAHPPCTYLAVSGNRWMKPEYRDRFPDRPRLREEALDFVRALLAIPVPNVCVENPVSVISSAIRPPDQIIQPWMFGHGEVKATCLWLKGLRPLVPTAVVDGRNPRTHRERPAPDRWKNRSRTLTGIAEAMADQWGRLRFRKYKY